MTIPEDAFTVEEIRQRYGKSRCWAQERINKLVELGEAERIGKIGPKNYFRMK